MYLYVVVNNRLVFPDSATLRSVCGVHKIRYEWAASRSGTRFFVSNDVQRYMHSMFCVGELVNRTDRGRRLYSWLRCHPMRKYLHVVTKEAGGSGLIQRIIQKHIIYTYIQDGHTPARSANIGSLPRWKSTESYSKKRILFVSSFFFYMKHYVHIIQFVYCIW